MMDIIWVAFGLFLVFEGIMPTLAPSAYRRVLERLSQQPEGAIRKAGLVIVGIGTIIIFIAKT